MRIFNPERNENVGDEGVVLLSKEKEKDEGKELEIHPPVSHTFAHNYHEF